MKARKKYKRSEGVTIVYQKVDQKLKIKPAERKY